MSKKAIENLLKTKEKKVQELIQRSQLSQDIEEVRSLHSEIGDLKDEVEQLRAILEDINKDDKTKTDESWQEEKRGEEDLIQKGGLNPISTFKVGEAENRGVNEDMYGTMEYRMAFKDYIVKGTPIPDKYKEEQRADQLTTVGDVGVIITTTLLNKVIEDLTVEGKLLGRITQTAFKGGVDIPIADINPQATWLADEETVSDEQKAKLDAKISFGYHVLEAKVAIGLLTDTVTLSVFETTVVKQLKKAMIRTIEDSIIRGSGSGQPLGILNTELPEGKSISFTEEEIGTVTKWAEVEGEIPEVVEDSVIYVMSKPTWEVYLNGMTDKNGQKIGLGKINEKGQKILNGREVFTIDKLPSFKTASEGDVFGLVVDLSQYMLNSNLAMYYKKYFNEDKNKWIHKSLMIVDGKMAIGKTKEGKIIGADALMLLKKAGTP